MVGFLIAAEVILGATLFVSLGLVLWSLFNLNGMTVILEFLNSFSSTVIYILTLIYNILNAYTGGGFAYVWTVAFAIVSLWLGFQSSRVFITGVRILMSFILSKL